MTESPADLSARLADLDARLRELEAVQELILRLMSTRSRSIGCSSSTAPPRRKSRGFTQLVIDTLKLERPAYRQLYAYAAEQQWPTWS